MASKLSILSQVEDFKEELNFRVLSLLFKLFEWVNWYLKYLTLQLMSTLYSFFKAQPPPPKSLTQNFMTKILANQHYTIILSASMKSSTKFLFKSKLCYHKKGIYTALFWQWSSYSLSIKESRDQSFLCYCHKVSKPLSVLWDQECLAMSHLKGKEIQACCLEENHTILHYSKKLDMKDRDCRVFSRVHLVYNPHIIC